MLTKSTCGSRARNPPLFSKTRQRERPAMINPLMTITTD
jgi:hypothetical protein